MRTNQLIWKQRAELCQEFFHKYFWDEKHHVYNPSYPPRLLDGGEFHYWWQAHALDYLVDGFQRTGDPFYSTQISHLSKGIKAKNNGTIINDYYDDMEWLALAFLRAYQATHEKAYLDSTLLLWEDIKMGWNNFCGGGIAWRKPQLYYKNSPANGPAAILGARLYREIGGDEHRDWAVRIFEWLTANLVDAKSGFVWDGMNRTEDGTIDLDWRFTYCQGVYIGAALELYRIFGDQDYLKKAEKTAHRAISELADDQGILPNEGTSDGDEGLFKGIFIRYLTDLILETDATDFHRFLLKNGESLWSNGREEPCFFSRHWGKPFQGPASLSVQLSGGMLIEALALLEERVVTD